MCSCFLFLSTSSCFQPQENRFYRNNRYRSTIQNGGSPSPISPSQTNRIGTPTLRTTYIPPGLSRGSSRTSLNSTNPFDDEYVETASQISNADSVSAVRRSGRKKRKAPQPPSMVRSTSPKSPVSQIRFPNIYNQVIFILCANLSCLPRFLENELHFYSQFVCQMQLIR